MNAKLSLKTVIHETSSGSRALFEKCWPQAAVFEFPSNGSESLCVADAKANVIPAVREWRERGIMPFPYTATSVIAGARARYRSRSVFTMAGPAVLAWVTQIDFALRDQHLYYYGAYELRDDRPDAEILNFTFLPDKRDNELPVLAWPGDLAEFVWLNRALSSVRYTVVERRISRQEARATNSPRTVWTIHVRSPRASSTSMRAQFKDVVQAAHAVRGHLRTNHRTGQKSIQVRPHIRGRLGNAVQLKDYVVHAEAAL